MWCIQETRRCVGPSRGPDAFRSQTKQADVLCSVEKNRIVSLCQSEITQFTPGWSHLSHIRPGHKASGTYHG